MEYHGSNTSAKNKLLRPSTSVVFGVQKVQRGDAGNTHRRERRMFKPIACDIANPTRYR